MNNDRFKFRAVLKTDDLCVIVPVLALYNDYYMIDVEIAKEIFEKKYPDKCFYGDFTDELEKKDDFDYDDEGDFLLLKDLDNLMQCLPLKDKNGNLIYDGDILITDDRGKPIKCFVYFGANDFDESITGYCFNFGNTTDSIQAGSCEKLKVVGNIYENKELLELE